MPFLRPTYIIAILIAITIHECAHAYAARRLGDHTAEDQGRLTLNPVSHIDPLGALMFLVVGFGWAKPVPVNPLHFRNPNRDMAITAIAGPVSNLLVAIISFALLALLGGIGGGSVLSLLDGDTAASPAMTVAMQILDDSLFVNLALMAFNLFPVAPLDGSSVLRIAIPRQFQDRYEDFIRVGPWILLGLILFESFLPFPILSLWVHSIMDAVYSVFLWISGFVD